MRPRQKRLSVILKDSRISDFDRAVYKAVSEIPRGRTRPYKWVAERIGNPQASRAVGNALNRNPYPLVIPCHRVVRSDGSPGGYSRGAALKKRLLAREGIDCRGIG